jgi:hypothetical protein
MFFIRRCSVLIPCLVPVLSPPPMFMSLFYPQTILSSLFVPLFSSLLLLYSLCSVLNQLFSPVSILTLVLSPPPPIPYSVHRVLTPPPLSETKAGRNHLTSKKPPRSHWDRRAIYPNHDKFMSSNGLSPM